MPAEYSLKRNIISESFGQGQIARSRFITYGFAVLILCQNEINSWERGAYVMHTLFEVSKISMATFSHKPGGLTVPYDNGKDFSHSL
jgi:hypothetical protein